MLHFTPDLANPHSRGWGGDTHSSWRNSRGWPTATAASKAKAIPTATSPPPRKTACAASCPSGWSSSPPLPTSSSSPNPGSGRQNLAPATGCPTADAEKTARLIPAAWRTQHLRRLAGPVLTPLGGLSVYPAWRAQYLSRLAAAQTVQQRYGRKKNVETLPATSQKPTPHLSRLPNPAFTPLGGPSVYPAWRVQCLSRLAGPVFIPLGGPSVDAVWRAQC